MKWLYRVLLAAVLVLPGQASAQDLSGKWRYLHLDAVEGTKWFQNEGNAVVEYANGKIRAHFYTDGSKTDVQYELTGSLKLGKSIQPEPGILVQEGRITASVKTDGSDVGDPDPYQGTYTKITYSDAVRGKTRMIPPIPKFAETIILGDGINVLTLQRHVQ
jgi:hypothetical protein